MTNEQILKKAVRKAQNNGYGRFVISSSLVRRWDISGSYYKIIFSHDFAKAFFTCHYVSREFNGVFLEDGEETWRIALQQMVLETEPLKYLERFL